MASIQKLTLVTQEVITSYQNGLSIRQIADLHDCNPGTVRNLLRKEGVVMRSRGRARKVQG